MNELLAGYDGTPVGKPLMAIDIQANATGAASRRIAELDGLRAIAILCVFVYHALAVPLLWLGVDLFFVLSGFLITGVLLDTKNSGLPYFRHFYSRRARRILPPYVVLMLVSSLLFGTAWARHWYWYVFFGTNIAGALHQVGHEGLVPLWSLAVEEQFYFVWPLVIFICPERLLFKIATTMLLLAPLLRGLATPLFNTHFPIYYLTPFRMDLLCAGALLCLFWRTSHGLFQHFELHAWSLTALSISVLLWFGRYPQFHTGSNTVVANTFIYSLVLVLVTSFMVIALIGKGPICRLLRWSPLRWIGKISYSMYLIHMSAIILTRQILGGGAVVFLVSLALTILYGAGTWYGFERRLLNPTTSTKVLTPVIAGT